MSTPREIPDDACEECQMVAHAYREQNERLREAIDQACYALDPNQGERPSPMLAYEWLRTTFAADHPNYVARSALEASSEPRP